MAGTPPLRSLHPGPCASIPFYEMVSIRSIGRRLLSTSASLVLARKQVSTADLSKAKMSFKNFFFFFCFFTAPLHLISLPTEHQESFSYKSLQTSKGRGLGCWLCPHSPGSPAPGDVSGLLPQPQLQTPQRERAWMVTLAREGSWAGSDARTGHEDVAGRNPASTTLPRVSVWYRSGAGGTAHTAWCEGCLPELHRRHSKWSPCSGAE